MISQAYIFMKRYLSDRFILHFHHKSTNLLKKCLVVPRVHPSVVSTSGSKSGLIQFSLSGIPRGVENGFGSQGAQFLTSSTSSAVAILSSKKWHPSNHSMGHSQNKTKFSTFSSAIRINHRVLSPTHCDSVRFYSNKTSENVIITETNSLNSETPVVLDSNLENPQRKLPQKLEIVRSKIKLSEHIADDFEAETDFVYGGRREETNVPYSNAIPKLLEDDHSKEAPLPSEVRTGNIKALSHLITNAGSCSDVLHIYEQHLNQLNFLHYDLIAKRITDVIDRSLLEEVYSHPVFVQLCERLCKNCRQYDPPMLLSLLQMLNNLKLPPDALIMLTTLQMLRKKIDILDVKELLLLDVLLSSSQQGALGNALQKAVPLALECLYSSFELPTSLSPSHLAHGLYVCANSDGVEALALTEKFVMALYEHEQGVEALEGSEAMTLISGLLEVFQCWKSTAERRQPELREEDEDQLLTSQPSISSDELFVEQLAVAREGLLEEALQSVAQNISQLSSYEMEKLQSLLSCAYRNGDRSARSQELLDSFVGRTVEEDGSFQALAAGVSWMLKMDAVDESLVQTLLKKLFLAPSEELCYAELPVLPVIHALVASDALQGQPQEKCHLLLDKLLEHPSTQLQSPEGVTVAHTRLAIDLACLGFFEPSFYGTVLDCAAADARKCLEASSPGSGVHQFMAIWQALQLLAPQHCSVQVDEKLLSESKQFLQNRSYLSSSRNAERDLVRQLLQHALSSHGPDSVVTRVHTRHALLIDHVLVVRGSGEVVPQPAAAKGQNRQGYFCLDDLTVPDGSRVLGVVQVGAVMLLNNYSMMRPLVRLELQLLAAEGVTVVPVIMPNLMQYYRTDEEKLGYVLEALKQHSLCL